MSLQPTEPPLAPEQGTDAPDRLPHPLDSADNYRGMLALRPKYDRALEGLERVKSVLVPLARRTAAVGTSLLRTDEWFQFYVSPFELLQLTPAAVADVRAVQRAKKRLVQELQLNDGRVLWLHDQPFDLSAAHAIDAELLDPERARWHRAVYRCPTLLNFLTRGDVRHFLYSDDFPRKALELLQEEAGFRTFLSRPYARQYDLVLTRAMQQSQLGVVEALLSGRRWVEPEHVDVCLDGASRHVAGIVEAVGAFASGRGGRRVGTPEVEEVLSRHALPDLFNLLPATFGSQQAEIVRTLRNLAVDVFTEHGGLSTLRGTLRLCRRFVHHDADVGQKIAEDMQTIERMAAAESEHDVRLQLGPERPFEITADGLRDGPVVLRAKHLTALRWGAVMRTEGLTRYEYVFAARDDTEQAIVAEWETDAEGAPAQLGYLDRLAAAARHHLAGAVVARLAERLFNGERIVVGPFTLSRQGIRFLTGVQRAPVSRSLTWQEATIEVRNDLVIVSGAPGVAASAPACRTENAVLLPMLRAAVLAHPSTTLLDLLGPQATRESAHGQPAAPAPTAGGSRPPETVGDRVLHIVVTVLLGVLILGGGVFLNSRTKARQSAPVPKAVQPQETWRLPKHRAPDEPDIFAVVRELSEEEDKLKRVEKEAAALQTEIEREQPKLDRSDSAQVAAFRSKIAELDTLIARRAVLSVRCAELRAKYNQMILFPEGSTRP